jgi:hypothetical protein
MAHVSVLATLTGLVDADNFRIVPEVKSSAEGITVGIAPDHNIYVASSGSNAGGTMPVPTGPANLWVITPTGGFTRDGRDCTSQTCGVRIQGASANVLGLHWRPASQGVPKQLWVIDPGTGNGQVLHINPANGDRISVIASNFDDGAYLNALTFDSEGNGYVTDSGLGRIYKISPSATTPVTIWSNDRRLKALTQWTQGTCPNPAPPRAPDLHHRYC